jgi:copper chaperone CopZ
MKNLFLSMAVLALVLASCEKEAKEVEKKSTELAGDISTKVELDPTITTYTLTGTVTILSGGELHIPAGTTIKAQKGFGKYILVDRGGKIFINGTAEKPVTMTADDDNNTANGYWGGLIINGYARISGPAGVTTTSSTEIAPAYLYGGDNDDDNSGSITYLKLLYTGAKASASTEHNGLTLNGVGRGTKIENIYIADAADDAIEWFGGSVNVKNLLVVNSDDDMFDVTQGWTGTLDNAYGIWEPGFVSGEEDPRGCEIDGNLDGNFPNHVNQADFVMKNITIVNKSTFEMHDAIKVRRGAKANITNILIKGGPIKDIIDLKDGKGNSHPGTVIEYKVEGATISGAEVNGTDGTATVKANITGADVSVFGWTGYNF